MNEILELSRITHTLENLDDLLDEMERELNQRKRYLEQREDDLKWHAGLANNEAVSFEVALAAHAAIPEIEGCIESLKRVIAAEKEQLNRELKRRSRMQAHAESLNEMVRSRPTMYHDFALKEAAMGTDGNRNRAGGLQHGARMAKAEVA